MKTIEKESILKQIITDFGAVEKIGSSDSLYQLQNSNIRIYFRYSKLHDRGTTFYGLRASDLKELEGYPSVICFLWNGQQEPVFIPGTFFEEILAGTNPASDGQYKAQIYIQNNTIEIYFPKIGKFNIEGYFGWSEIESLVQNSEGELIPDLGHSQIQSLLGAIGSKKNFDIFIPKYDRLKMDWNLVPEFQFREITQGMLNATEEIAQEIDVIWISRGSNQIQALFEVEHSTPIYSGLLRLNDILLTNMSITSTFSIVSNTIRNSAFSKQINRPTFRVSGLLDRCNFLDYQTVYKWQKRIISHI